MERLSTELNLPEHLTTFTASYRHDPYPFGLTIVWVPNLLGHLVGPEIAAQLLRLP